MKRIARILASISFLWLNMACGSGQFFGNTNSGGVSQTNSDSDVQSQEAGSDDWISVLESSRLDVAIKNRDYIEEHIGNDTIELEGFEFANLLDIAEDNIFDLESSPEGDLTVAERFEELGLDPYSFEAPSTDEFDEAMQLMSEMSLFYDGADSDQNFEMELKLQASCPDMSGHAMGQQIQVMGQIEAMLTPKGGWPDQLTPEQQQNALTVQAAAAIGTRMTIERSQAASRGCPNMTPDELAKGEQSREPL